MPLQAPSICNGYNINTGYKTTPTNRNAHRYTGAFLFGGERRGVLGAFYIQITAHVSDDVFARDDAAFQGGVFAGFNALLAIKVALLPARNSLPMMLMSPPLVTPSFGVPVALRLRLLPAAITLLTAVVLVCVVVVLLFALAGLEGTDHGVGDAQSSPRLFETGFINGCLHNQNINISLFAYSYHFSVKKVLLSRFMRAYWNSLLIIFMLLGWSDPIRCTIRCQPLQVDQTL